MPEVNTATSATAASAAGTAVGPDFAMVRLTARGQELAGGAALHLGNGRRSFTFTGSEPQKVERSYEWAKVLAVACDAQGQPLFELVPPAPAPAKTSAAASEPEAAKPVTATK